MANSKIHSSHSVRNEQIDLIFNTTLICQWDCEFCCVDAVQVKREADKLIIKSNNLQKIEKFEITDQNIYNQASKIRSSLGLELTLDKKKKIIDNVKEYNVRIDISGGDALLVSEN